MALKEQSRYIVADLMPAPRTLDPLGFSQEPNYVTDPVREAELVREIVNKICYVIWSYHQAKKLGLDNESFNASLKQLKLAVNNPGLIRLASFVAIPSLKWRLMLNLGSLLVSRRMRTSTK
ncbi:MAG: hypothetical protein WBL20_18910 [Sphingobium sp.]|uniref:hypothetical protein n=1 Tax=Sphingobium sp. TaxID=1912891 RepID=UPI002E23FF3C